MKVGSPLIPSSLRLGLTLTIVLMVMSSPILIFLNPVLISAKSGNSVDTSGQHSAFSLEGTSSTPLTSPPSPTNVSPMDSDFTTQAALSLTRASQTNNFVASKAYYDISFRTATAGVIKSVVMDFPTGTSVGSALVVEATGIGPGTLAASAGEVLTYTVTNAVNVPVNTIIRIQISNINNPPSPSASLTVSITTMDVANMPIDGPTPTFAYNMVQVSNAQIAPGAVTTTKIANGAVTTGDIADDAVTNSKLAPFAVDTPNLVGDSVTNSKIADQAVTNFKLGDFSVSTNKIGINAITNDKIAESFMKRVTVLDDAAGHAVGWNPDGNIGLFQIEEPDMSGIDNVFFVVAVTGANGLGSANPCVSTGVGLAPDTFQIVCLLANPSDGSELHYVVGNLPAHLVS